MCLHARKVGAGATGRGDEKEGGQQRLRNEVTAFLDDGFAAEDAADGSEMGLAKTLLIADELTYQSAPTCFITDP